MSTVKVPGLVVGTPGGTISDDAAWVRNAGAAAAGRAGESRTAAVLDAAAARPGGPSVLHDLRIPLAGVRANIDHVVVSGRTVHIYDSKVWRPGLYWTLAGRTRRGGERVPHIDKSTGRMALDALRALLARTGINVHVVPMRLVVWASRPDGVVRCSLVRAVGGVRALRGERLAGRLRHFDAADPHVVQALARLVNTPARRDPVSSRAVDPQDREGPGDTWSMG